MNNREILLFFIEEVEHRFLGIDQPTHGEKMTLLQLNTSIFSGDGQSSRLADEYVARIRAVDPETRLVVRDLARGADPSPDGRDVRRVSREAGRPDPRAAAGGCILRCVDRRVEARRFHRHRVADVQLRRSVDA
jgi:hypothetical protein